MASETAIVIAIGNSDDRLSQREWAELYTLFDEWIAHFQGVAGVTIHGRWLSPSHSPYQNAAWSLSWDNDLIHLTRDLQFHLRGLLHDYRQDTMAWTVGQTKLVPALAPATVSEGEQDGTA